MYRFYKVCQDAVVNFRNWDYMKRVGLVATLGVLITSGSAGAALHDRGRGLVYDDVLDITWMANANPIGRATWDSAMAWADSLAYAGFDDWRLPSAFNRDGSAPCSGDNCSGSELGYMYYINMGATAPVYPARGTILDGTNKDNLALFTNIQADNGWYWFETESAPDYAWNFDNEYGGQYPYYKETRGIAWAVRDGDVPSIDEPQIYPLMLLGLSVIGYAVRRRKSNEDAHNFRPPTHM